MNQNRRSIIVKDRMWKKLKSLAKEESRSMSELIREAIVDLFRKRTQPVSHGYDPIKDKL